MSDKEIHKKTARTLEYLAKGILLGCSLGAIAGWFFMDMGKAIFLGGLCGCLAGITFKNQMDKREGK